MAGEIQMENATEDRTFEPGNIIDKGAEVGMTKLSTAIKNIANGI
jgi:hypothetical protein